jgi:hypothetical protein
MNGLTTLYKPEHNILTTSLTCGESFTLSKSFRSQITTIFHALEGTNVANSLRLQALLVSVCRGCLSRAVGWFKRSMLLSRAN